LVVVTVGKEVCLGFYVVYAVYDEVWAARLEGGDVGFLE
jgi:hypothetical protein